MRKQHKSKYGNKKIIYDGIKFDSIVEKDRYIYLIQQQKRGKIRDLELQKSFLLLDKFVYKGKTIRAITYKADFCYIDNVKGGLVVEDVKGILTTEFKLKAKLFKHRYTDVDFFVVKKNGIRWLKEI